MTKATWYAENIAGNILRMQCDLRGSYTETYGLRTAIKLDLTKPSSSAVKKVWKMRWTGHLHDLAGHIPQAQKFQAKHEGTGVY